MPADLSGCITVDGLYDGPFCVSSIVDNRRYCRLIYEVLDHDPMLDLDPTHDDMIGFFRRFQRALKEPAGWAEDEATSTGINGQVGGRNSPTVINSAHARALFWDGRAKDLEEQALGPIENPIEMGHKLDDVVKGLSEVPEYQQRFQKVFGTGVTKEGIAMAIASFERTVLSGRPKTTS